MKKEKDILKIAHIIPSLNKGGAERFVVDLCNELAHNSSLKIFLISLKDNGNKDTFLEEVNPRVMYISLGKKAGLSLRTIIKLTRYLLKNNIHIIHTHTGALEYAYIFRCISRSRKSFHTIHNRAEKELPFRFLKGFRRYVFQRIFKPVTISRDGRESFNTLYRLNNDTLIYNGCPMPQRSPRYATLRNRIIELNKDYIFLHVGRISKEKNQKLLIKAFLQLEKNLDERCLLIMIGGVRDPNIDNELRGIAKGSDNILWLGTQTDIIDYLSVSDAFCLSSDYEGMPISLIEALSAGCIPICTPVGGIPEMVENGVTGFLSTEVSQPSYYRAMMNFIEASDKDVIKRSAQKNFLSKFRISTTADKYLELYHSKT